MKSLLILRRGLSVNHGKPKLLCEGDVPRHPLADPSSERLRLIFLTNKKTGSETCFFMNRLIFAPRSLLHQPEHFLQ
jgi:hypothetical protein